VADEPKGVPPVTSKSIKRESLERGQRADTGGDPYDRMRNNYSKSSKKSEDPFDFLD